MKKIAFTVHGQTVTGTILYPDKVKGKLPAILYIHGWTSNETGYIKRAQAICDLGAIGLTINLRGHGTSDGNINRLSRKDHLADVLAAYDFLLDQDGVNPAAIGICGSSYGGYLAALLSDRKNVLWLGMRAPALYIDDDFEKPTATLITDETRYFKETRRYENSMALSAIRHYKHDLLLIESGSDETIPHTIVERYSDAVKDPRQLTYEVIPDADHQLSQPAWQQKFIEMLVNWFRPRINGVF